MGYVPSNELIKINRFMHHESLPDNLGNGTFSKMQSKDPGLKKLIVPINYAALGGQLDLKEIQVKTIFSQFIETLVNLSKKKQTASISINLFVGSLSVNGLSLRFEQPKPNQMDASTLLSTRLSKSKAPNMSTSQLIGAQNENRNDLMGPLVTSPEY